MGEGVNVSKCWRSRAHCGMPPPLWISRFTHAAACCRPPAWLQVAYRERIRGRYFGRDYAPEVAWVDGGGSGSGNRSDIGGGQLAVDKAAATGAGGAVSAGRRRSVLLKEE